MAKELVQMDGDEDDPKAGSASVAPETAHANVGSTGAGSEPLAP
jgi:hypothetical protein